MFVHVRQAAADLDVERVAVRTELRVDYSYKSGHRPCETTACFGHRGAQGFARAVLVERRFAVALSAGSKQRPQQQAP
jgi:hypothetical protein